METENNGFNVEINHQSLREAVEENDFVVSSTLNEHFAPPSDHSSIPSDNIEGDYDFGSAGSRRESDGESWETVSEEMREQADALEQERVSVEALLMKNATFSQRLMLRNKNEHKQLPENVTQIVTNDGAYIYVIGTAHFSKASQEDVETCIKILQPDVVMVELCASRVGVLKYDEESLLKAAKEINFEKLKYSIKESGSVVSGVMQLLLLNMSAHITQQLGMAPGGEFRVACREARQVPGCKVVLGDRPIQSTIGRAMGSLSIYQKLQLGWHLLFSKENITAEDVEKYKQKDMIAEMLAEMTGDFPELSRVFVEERDKYMAQMLTRYVESVRNDLPEIIPIRKTRNVMMQSFQEMSDLENEDNGIIEEIRKSDYKPVIIAVVGIGHMNGIANNVGKEFDIHELTRIPEPSIGSRAVTFTFKASVVAVLSWGIYSFVRWIKW